MSGEQLLTVVPLNDIWITADFRETQLHKMHRGQPVTVHVEAVADGRGTPNRGIAWEQAVHHNYFDAALEDQVEVLHSAAERFPFMDTSKVAIRGSW